MTDNRIVNLVFSKEEKIDLCNLVGIDNVQADIGRLACWNFDYPSVSIWIADPKDGELRAAYFRENGTTGYVIGAIFRDGKYEFHS